MSAHAITTTYEDGATPVDVRIFFDFSPGDPAVLTGPLENARPPSDPAVEFDRVQVLGPDGSHTAATAEMVDWAKQWVERHAEDCVGAAVEELDARADQE